MQRWGLEGQAASIAHGADRALLSLAQGAPFFRGGSKDFMALTWVLLVEWDF